jgi:hypothetical protein
MTDSSPTKLGNYSLAHLRGQSDRLKSLIAECKAEQDAITAELARRLGAGIAAQLAAAGKSVGSITVDTPEGIKLKGEIKQTVKWDSSALQDIAAGMSFNEWTHYFKIAFAVPEGIYKAVPPGALKDAFTAARTTKTSGMVVSFVEAKE